MDPRDIVTMIAKLNPNNIPGRLTIITRMGAKAMRDKLPKLIEAVQQAGQIVTWVTDPMHGNTETVSGYKTRRFDNIRAEIEVGEWVGEFKWQSLLADTCPFARPSSMSTMPWGLSLEASTWR